MSQRLALLALFALLATAAAVVFLAISIDPDVYAPGAKTLEHHLPGRGRLHHVEHRLPHAARVSPAVFLRKLYSIVAFGIVGFFAAPLLPRRARLRWDTALIAGFSLLIEIAQKLIGSHEGYASNLFDIGCGAVGGLIGAVLWNGVARSGAFGRPRL
ncbi:MAG: VanZ family protein [Candidatus Eremiobacteraeota bacterium]|nr:VanZ family protein [Candidatus Eremiobacteraeota bacterium]